MCCSFELSPAQDCASGSLWQWKSSLVHIVMRNQARATNKTHRSRHCRLCVFPIEAPLPRVRLLLLLFCRAVQLCVVVLQLNMIVSTNHWAAEVLPASFIAFLARVPKISSMTGMSVTRVHIGCARKHFQRNKLAIFTMNYDLRVKRNKLSSKAKCWLRRREARLL